MPRTKAFDTDVALERALQLFWKQGYNATSMQEIVDALGVNRASIYDTFGNKRALFLAAFAKYRVGNLAQMSAFMASHSSVKKAFQELFTMAVHDSITDLDRKGCFVVNTTSELAAIDPEIQKITVQNRINVEAIFTTELRRGVANGEISEVKNVTAIASMLFTLFGGLKVIAKTAPDRIMLEESIETALTVLD